MDINEAKTRQEIIDVRLLRAGWDVHNPAQVTSELDIWVGLPEGIEEPENEYQGFQFADYALLGDDGYPLAVVEAKKTSKDARIGQEQARQYAENIQKNSGRDMPFVFYTNGNDIYFWDTEKYPPRKVYGFSTKKDLERLLFLRKNEKPISQELINRDLSGRPYQIEALRSVFESFDKGKRKALLVMATGTGKTRTCVSMADVLMRTNRVQKVLFLVDRIALRNQALDAFKEYLPNAPVWPKIGESEIVTDRRVYVATYPTMLNIIEDKDCPLSPLFFDMIVADESHRSIYNVYKNIFDYFDALQLGLTATPKDAVEHNTFSLFNCEDGIPTYAYSYEEAINHNPPYLCDYEVLKIKTKFQKEETRNLLIFFAEFRSKLFNAESLKYVFSKERLESLKNFDDFYFKEQLEKVLISYPSEVKSGFAWSFWHLPKEPGVNFDDTFKISYKYMKLLTQTYDHDVMVNLYYFISDFIDKNFEECIDLWKKSLQVERPYLEQTATKDNLYQLSWWPYHYNGKILKMIYDKNGYDEFLQWLNYLLIYPDGITSIGDISVAVDCLTKMPVNPKTKATFRKVVSKYPEYFEIMNKWLGKK